MRQLYYWLYRKFNKNNLPCPEEILDLYSTRKQDSTVLDSWTNRIVSIACKYSVGESLEQIAAENELTTERVRQCILKFYFVSKRVRRENEKK